MSMKKFFFTNSPWAFSAVVVFVIGNVIGITSAFALNGTASWTGVGVEYVLNFLVALPLWFIACRKWTNEHLERYRQAIRPWSTATAYTNEESSRIGDNDVR